MAIDKIILLCTNVPLLPVTNSGTTRIFAEEFFNYSQCQPMPIALALFSCDELKEIVDAAHGVVGKLGNPFFILDIINLRLGSASGFFARVLHVIGRPVHRVFSLCATTYGSKAHKKCDQTISLDPECGFPPIEPHVT